MSAFDSRMDESSESMGRSRSTPERGTVDAASHRIIAQGTSISESSSSESRGRNVQRAPQLVPTNQTAHSPDATLSQYTRGDSHEQSPISLPSNPFQPPRNPTDRSPPGTGFGQGSSANRPQNATFVRNELNVSVDPLILAEANQIVDRTRQEALQFAGTFVGQVRSEAETLLEQERAKARIEASQFVNQIHHEAQRVVDETQSKAATEVQSVVNRASNEVELIKAQANAELSRLRVESQKQVSMLEGRMTELIRINENLHKKQNKQTAFVDSLIQQIHNQNQVIS